MSLFWFDRLQYSNTLNKLIIFEFFETDISNINAVDNNSWNSKSAEIIFDKFTYKKHCIIRNLMKTNSDLIFYLILFTNNDLDKKIVVEYTDHFTRIIHEFSTFKDLQIWFLEINNIDGDSYSKSLGKIKSNTEYASKLLFEYWKADINTNDDQGLEFTKKLLTYMNNKGEIVEATTKGFDFDLFIYFRDNDSLINIEFALNEKGVINNYKCTPMRYCWGHNPPRVPDNKMKYNRLWKATKLLNGEFSILNYSDIDQNFGFSIINSLDYNVGFLNETKFLITKDNFEKSLLATINETRVTFANFEVNSKDVKVYDEDFFNKWPNNKNDY